MLTLVLLSVVFVLFAIKFVEFRRFNDKLEKFGGPKLHWLKGTAIYYPTLDVVIPVLMKLLQKHNGIVRIQNGCISKKILWTTNYNLVKKMLSSDKLFPKSHKYHIFSNWIGDGLLIAVGQTWHHKRKLLTPAFHFKILEQLVDVVNSTSKVLLQNLAIEATKEVTNAYDIMKTYTFDVLTETALGIKINAQTNKYCNYINCITNISMLITERIFSPYKNINFFYKFTQSYRREMEYIRISNESVNMVIENREKELRCNIDDMNDDGLGKKRKSFIDILLTSEHQLSRKDIQNEVNTFMAAGYDTTAVSLSFALYNLSKNLHVQDKIFEEQLAIFKDDIYADVSYASLSKMSYLEMVLKESLRLFPSIPFVSKVATEDIEYDGKIIPKGTAIAIFIHGMHRDPNIYSEPHKFDPERFSSQNKSKRGHYSYIPFSAGTRNCIGQKFAMLEMKATLSTILRRFIIKEVPGYEPKLYVTITTNSMNGVQIKLEPRIL